MRKPGLQKRTAALPWDDLRYVLAVARNSSLSGAARGLGTRHSTVFRRLNALEKRLGVKLFERTRAGYAPTMHGEFAAAAARAMEAEAIAVERRMLGADARLAGTGVAVLPLFAADHHGGLARLGAVLDQPRVKLWVLSHREVRDNARVRALSRYFAKHLPRVLTARQKIDNER